MRQRIIMLTCVVITSTAFMLLALFSGRPTPVHAESIAYIRVIHASPDVGIVNGTPHFQLISAQVSDIREVPGTGSSPHAVSTESTHPFAPWMLGIAFFLTIIISCATRHYMTRVRA